MILYRFRPIFSSHPPFSPYPLSTNSVHHAYAPVISQAVYERTQCVPSPYPLRTLASDWSRSFWTLSLLCDSCLFDKADSHLTASTVQLTPTNWTNQLQGNRHDQARALSVISSCPPRNYLRVSRVRHFSTSRNPKSTALCYVKNSLEGFFLLFFEI